MEGHAHRPFDTGAGVLPATDRYSEVWGVMWQQWRDGQMVHERHHLDVLTLLGNIGALPG